MPNLIFKGRVIPGRAGDDVLGQLLDANAEVNYICMAGSCGTCKVRITAGDEHLEPRTDAEDFHCRDQEERLACQAVFRGTGDVTLEQ